MSLCIDFTDIASTPPTYRIDLTDILSTPPTHCIDLTVLLSTPPTHCIDFTDTAGTPPTPQRPILRITYQPSASCPFLADPRGSPSRGRRSKGQSAARRRHPLHTNAHLKFPAHIGVDTCMYAYERSMLQWTISTHTFRTRTVCRPYTHTSAAAITRPWAHSYS